MTAFAVAAIVVCLPLKSHSEGIRIYGGSSGASTLVSKDGTVRGPAMAAPGGTSPSLKTAATGVCQSPIAVSKADYKDEKIVYDISDKEALSGLRNVMSKFDHTRRIDYQPVMIDGCLTGLTTIISVYPVIHLPRVLGKGGGGIGCEIQGGVDSERQFSRQTAEAYKALGKEIETLATDTLANKNISEKSEAVSLVKSTVMNSGLLASFDKAQKERRRVFQNSQGLKEKTLVMKNYSDCSKGSGEKGTGNARGRVTYQKR